MSADIHNDNVNIDDINTKIRWQIPIPIPRFLTMQNSL